MEPVSRLPSDESRLAVLCKGGIESVWLAAAGLLPLLLNPTGTLATFEAPKLACLRMLALLGLAAWGVLLVESRFTGGCNSARGRFFGSKSITLVAALLAAVVALSTGLSIDPATSFWGSPEIYQGALTWAAQLALFALVVVHLRFREQARRLVTVLLLGSFAVSLMAVAQWLGWDPMLPGARGGRVFATIGNPIYLAEYLMMILPVTIWRIMGLLEGGRTLIRSRRLMLALYAVILLTQMAAFFCAGSRGPMLAAGASLFAMALLHARLKSRRGLQRSLVAAAVCVALAVAGAAVWFKQQKAGDGASRFAFMGERGDSGRGDYWLKASEMLLPSAAEGKTPPALLGDPWKALRLWIGHGPETLPAILPFYHATVDGLTLESWFHNIVWDLWFAHGLLGLGAFLTFFWLVFWRAYQRLGFISSRAATLRFALISVIMTMSGACLLPWLFENAGFAGMGVVLGLTTSLILFPAWAGRSAEIMPPVEEKGDAALIATLVAGLAGYLADLAFVFPTACSSVVFWLYAGVILVACRGMGDAPVAPQASRPEVKRKNPAASIEALPDGEFPLPAAVVCASAGVISLLHLCLMPSGGIPHRFSLGELLSITLFNPTAKSGPLSLMILPVALFWVGASLMLARTAQNTFAKRLTWLLGLSAAAGMVFAGWESFMISRAVPLSQMRGLLAEAAERVHDQEILVSAYFGVVICLMAFAAWKLALPSRSLPAASIPGRVACGMAATAVITLAWFAVLPAMRADLFVQEGLRMQAIGGGSLASGLFKKAVALNPRPFLYRGMLGESLLSDAEALPDAAQAATLLAEAEAVLKPGRQERTINRADYYLGRVYLHRALREEGASRAELARKASLAFDQARAFEPHTEPVWTESGLVDLLLHQDAAAAKPKLERATELASRAFIAWAEFHSGRSMRARDTGMKQQLAQIAGQYFDGAILDPKLAKEFTSRARLGKAMLQFMHNETDAALANLHEAVKLGVAYDQWEIEMLLAEGYLQKSDRTASRRHLERSLAVVPPEKKHMLQGLQSELGVQ